MKPAKISVENTPIAYTVNAARNLPSAIPAAETGEVSSSTSVRFFLSSVIMRMVRITVKMIRYSGVIAE